MWNEMPKIPEKDVRNNRYLAFLIKSEALKNAVRFSIKEHAKFFEKVDDTILIAEMFEEYLIGRKGYFGLFYKERKEQKKEKKKE